MCHDSEPTCTINGSHKNLALYVGVTHTLGMIWVKDNFHQKLLFFSAVWPNIVLKIFIKKNLFVPEKLPTLSQSWRAKTIFQHSCQRLLKKIYFLSVTHFLVFQKSVLSLFCSQFVNEMVQICSLENIHLLPWQPFLYLLGCSFGSLSRHRV